MFLPTQYAGGVLTATAPCCSQNALHKKTIHVPKGSNSTRVQSNLLLVLYISFSCGLLELLIFTGVGITPGVVLGLAFGKAPKGDRGWEREAWAWEVHI